MSRVPLILVALVCPAMADEPARDKPAGSLAEQFRAFEKEYRDALQDYYKASSRTKDEDASRRLYEEQRRRHTDYDVRALKIAEANPDDPAAVEYLCWIIINGYRDGSWNRAIAHLSREYVASERLGDACRRVGGMRHVPAAERFLRDVIARNPHHNIQGIACAALAETLANRAEFQEYLAKHPAEAENFDRIYGAETIKWIAARSPEEWNDEAAALYERIIDRFADVVVTYKQNRKATLGDEAKGLLFRLRHLREGKPAPEIEGEDAEGARFQLSDYRGKVVLLTFSGNWCGPCRGFYPHERALVERLKGRPFVDLSVNTDETRETLKKSIADGEITWRCWWDGGVDGPITMHWGVGSFPTIYLIDHRGIIRLVDPDRDGDEIDKVAEALVKDAEPTK